MSGVGRIEASQWETFDGIAGDIAGKVPILKDIVKGVAAMRIFVCVVSEYRASRIATAGAPRCSANTDVREHQTAEDPDSPLSFSMEGYEGQPPVVADNAFLGAIVEFRSVGDKISKRGRGAALRRRPGRPADRAETIGQGCVFRRNSRYLRQREITLCMKLFFN